MKYGITKEEVARYGISYSASRRRIVLPLYSGSELASYQTRRIFMDDEKPKYLTYRNIDCVGLFASSSTGVDTCVVVEDYLSAIKVSRHVDCYYLQGTTASTDTVCWILRQGYKRGFVWLDDDNRAVKRNQLVLKNTFDLIIPEVSIIHTAGRDPKEHNDAEIKLILGVGHCRKS